MNTSIYERRYSVCMNIRWGRNDSRISQRIPLVINNI